MKGVETEPQKASSASSNKQTLTQRILAIQSNKESLNDLLIEYRYFIQSAAYKAIGKPVSVHSDEMNVAQIAFVEAVQCYDAKKGSFLTFCRWVIRLRLIDHLRKESRKSCEIVFSDLPEHMQNESFEANPLRVINQIDNPIRLEIDALAMDLKVYEINFTDLVAVSPKARKTKMACAKAVRYLLSNNETLKQMRNSQRLPIKKIQENCSIPRKLVERHRKYIIAVTEILSGEYPCLEEYVSFVKGGELS